jgi:hypothetical protein
MRQADAAMPRDPVDVDVIVPPLTRRFNEGSPHEAALGEAIASVRAVTNES